MTNGAPLVSIVTIFRDEEQFLPSAFRSVVDQSLGDWELILVDDGSTDSSTRFARAQADAMPGRVRYVEHADHRNLGMSASRNAGIDASCGRYVTFLDADDVWLPDKLMAQVPLLEQCSDAGFLVAPATYWHSWTGDPDDRARDHEQSLLAERALPDGAVVEPPALLLDFLRDEWRSLCDVVVRRSVLDDVGGYEPSFRGMYEDQAFHAKLCLRHRAAVSTRSRYLYRQHPAACTATAHAAGDWLRARRRFLRWLDAYAAAEGAEMALRAEIGSHRRSLQPPRRLLDRVTRRLGRSA